MPSRRLVATLAVVAFTLAPGCGRKGQAPTPKQASAAKTPAAVIPDRCAG